MIGRLDGLRRGPVALGKVPQRLLHRGPADDDRRALRARLPRQIERAAHQVLQLLLGKRLQLEHRVVPQLDRTAAGRGIALRLELEDGLTGAVLVQCSLAADLGAEGFGLHRAVRVRVDRVRAQGHVDDHAVCRALERHRVGIDAAVEHGGRLRREGRTDGLAQGLRVEAHAVFLLLPLGLEVPAGGIGVLAERERLRLDDGALREDPRAEEQLLAGLWGVEFEGETRTVDAHVGRIRKKLGWQDRIKTIPRIGYRLEVEF